jgi:hypothetical protein
MGIRLLCCGHGNEHMGIHDVVHDIFVAIVQDVSFHVGRKQLHAFPLATPNSSRRRVDILFTKDGICSLVDIVIINPTCVDLLPQSCTIQRFVTFNVV